MIATNTIEIKMSADDIEAVRELGRNYRMGRAPTRKNSKYYNLRISSKKKANQVELKESKEIEREI